MGCSATTPRRSRVSKFTGDVKPVAAAIALALGLGSAACVDAATFTVSTLADSGAGSLRAAVAAANTAVGADTINFTVSGTITLTTGEIAITDSVTVTGPGAGSMTLTKSGADSRIFNINANSPTVTISGLTFANAGGPTIRGGAIANDGGTLTIQSSVFTGNTAGNGGGALYSTNGPLNVSGSVFTGNSVGTVNDGGRDGGALYISTGNVTINNTTISGNFCGNDGGGIYHSEGLLTITNSTLSNNQAQYGSAISRFCGNCNLGYSNNSTTITNTTISGNSTFAGAVSTSYGGALFFYNATHTISNSTIANNSSPGGQGGGIHLYGGTLNLVSTIVSGSTDNAGNVGGGTRDIFARAGSGPFTVNATNSLVQNAGGFVNGTNSGNIFGQSPLLGALANNGGATQTMLLGAGSPAIDKGSNPLTLAFDQRGSGFPRVTGAQADIGAVEGAGAAPVSVLTPVPTLSQWGVALLSVLMAGWVAITGFGAGPGTRRRR